MKEFLNKKVKIRTSDPPSDFWLDKYNYGILVEVFANGGFSVLTHGVEYIYEDPKAWIIELDE